MASESGESLGGVSDTALGAAEMRAEESARPDRLFDDPYASAFVSAAPPLFPDIPSISHNAELAALKEAFIAEIAIRTRFYDDYLSAASASGCRQVVLLAAGASQPCFRVFVQTSHDWRVRTHARTNLAATYGRQLSQSATGGFLTAQRSHNTPVG